MREEMLKIFEHSDWSRGKEGVSRSGFGATRHATRHIRNAMPRLLETYKVKRLVDAPCGDFFWMKYVDLTGIEYWGWEVSESLIEANKKNYGSPTKHFSLGDITSDPFPEADMLMVRDCLVLLKFDMRWAFFENFVASNIPWLLIASWIAPVNPWVYKNGGHKSHSMTAAPFSFGPPVEFILETAKVLPEGEENNPESLHRGMGVWHRDQIAARVAEFVAAGRPIDAPKKPTD